MSSVTNEMLNGLTATISQVINEKDAGQNHLQSERIVPPQAIKRGEWPFTAEWMKTVRASEIPASFPTQADLFYQALVHLHPEWVSEKATKEAVAAYARMLGIPGDSDRETVAYALSWAMAISTTKIALTTGDPATWIITKTYFKGRSSASASYDPPTTKALKAIENLEIMEQFETKNPLTHRLGLGKFARSIVEILGGNYVGLTKDERRTVTTQLEKAARQRNINRSAAFFEERNSVISAIQANCEQLEQRLRNWLSMAQTLEEVAVFYDFCKRHNGINNKLHPLFIEHLLKIAKPFVDTPPSSNPSA